MQLFHAIILALVEGITEFLPISSTGHMVLVSQLLHVQQTEFVKSFEIIIQLGAILAIIVLYWKKLIQDKETWKRISIAFLPTGILGLVFYSFIKHYLLGNSFVTVLSLLIGGIVIILLEKYHQEKTTDVADINQITLKHAFFIGLCQSLSMIPGVSRAAATIFGALLLKTKRTAAVEFSFLLAVPTMAAASGLDIIKSGVHFTESELLLLGIGFVVTFITALLVVKYFVRFVQNHTFTSFGVYRIAIAILFLSLFGNFSIINYLCTFRLMQRY